MSQVDSEIRIVDAFDTQDRHLPLTRFIDEFGEFQRRLTVLLTH